jgi:hypothetical protein
MNRKGGGARRLVGLAEGQELPDLRLSVSAAANDRYWAGAGIDHPARAAGRLYPPMAANLTILAVQQVVDEPLLHTAQTLACHCAASAPADLVVRARCAGRLEKRGRDYAVVDAWIEDADGSTLWTSTATFTTVRR